MTSTPAGSGRYEVCDASPYLKNAARFHGEPTDERCPICRRENLTHVHYIYGDELKQSAGQARKRAELPVLAMTLREFQVYVVEVCRGCAWNHLVEQYLLGRDGLRRRRTARPVRRVRRRRRRRLDQTKARGPTVTLVRLADLAPRLPWALRIRSGRRIVNRISPVISGVTAATGRAVPEPRVRGETHGNPVARTAAPPRPAGCDE